MSAHAIRLLAAHNDDATHPRLELPGSALAPAIEPAAAVDNPCPMPGVCASDDSIESTRSGAAADVARAGRSRGSGIRGVYSR